MPVNHPDNGSCNMSEIISNMNIKLTLVEAKQDMLSEFFKEQLETMNKSMDRMATVAEETKALAVETRTQNILMKQDIEHRFEVQSMAIENKEQADEIEALSAKDKFISLWKEPVAKFVAGGFTLTLIYMASKMGIDLSNFVELFK